MGLGGAYAAKFKRDFGSEKTLPPFIAMLIVFGLYMFLTQLIGCLGAKRMSRVALALWCILTALGVIAQASFAAVVFAKPELVASYLNPDDHNKRVSGLLADPGEGAGTTLAIVVGFQLFAVACIWFFRSMITGDELEQNEMEMKARAQRKELRSEMEYEKTRSDFEMKAKKAVEKREKEAAKAAKKNRK
mmetsp:Transcript_30268/g.46472  ORF Transcript_30268/g.46472 Transcript_30268/m.46472 type:complete len:190 (+) Transcript_30268:1-570(+)